MLITIHRGINQIGGCITEIRSDSGTKILIDLGHNLPDGEKPIEDDLDLPENLDNLLKGVSAVLYTHHHGDHIGFESQVYKKEIPQYMGYVATMVMKILNARLTKAPELRRRAMDNLDALSNFKSYSANVSFSIGDVTITPYFVSHSASDAYMFLVECDGKKVLHTGDFREHGYLGKGLMKTINAYIRRRNIDVLITEGTMLSRDREKVLTEAELQEEAKNILADYNNVFVLCSSTDMDRIVSFYRATMAYPERLFVVDNYQAGQLDWCSMNIGLKNSLYRFNNYSKFSDVLLPKMVNSGFTMLIRQSVSFEMFLDRIIPQLDLSQTALIYSQFSGYLNPNHPAHKDELIAFVNKYQWAFKALHTSGHATQETLEKVCNAINPRLAIIPIHKDARADFRHLNISEELKSKVVEKSMSVDDVEIIIK